MFISICLNFAYPKVRSKYKIWISVQVHSTGDSNMAQTDVPLFYSTFKIQKHVQAG